MPVHQTKFGPLEYELIGNSNGKKILLIPPGAGKKELSLALASVLYDNYHVMLLNLPGVGKSECEYKCTQNLIVQMIFEVIEAEKFTQNLTIIGSSYGSIIAVKLSQILKTDKLLLIAPGNYFSRFTKQLLKKLFYPCSSHRSLLIYAKILSFLSKYKHFALAQLNDATKITATQRQNLINRWLEILESSYPFGDIPQHSFVFYGLKDKLVDKESIVRFQQIIQKNNLIALNCGHLEMDSYIANLYKQKLLSIIN